MRAISQVLRNPLCIGAMILRKFFCRSLPESLYLRLLYFFEQGKILHLNNPRLFTEKLQWLKLHNRKPEYRLMVDKIDAKDYVAKRISEKHIIRTLGVWNSFDEIDFSKLPDTFVLKSTNGGGGAVYICRGRKNFDKDKAREIVEKTQGKNIGLRYKEWPYLNIQPRIFAEELLSDGENAELKDYKFFCFDGEPLYCQVIADRVAGETIDFYDRDWVHQEFYGLNPRCKQAKKQIARPENFETMLELARKLSVGHPFLRIDLYNIKGRIYFGEMTFFPASGFGRFTPAKWDRILGDMINLH